MVLKAVEREEKMMEEEMMENKNKLGKILAITNFCLSTSVILIAIVDRRSAPGALALLILLNPILIPVSLIILYGLMGGSGGTDNGVNDILFMFALFIWFSIVGSIVWYRLPGFITRVYKKIFNREGKGAV